MTAADRLTAMTRSLPLAILLGAAALSLGACGKGDDSGDGQKATGHVESAVGDLTGSEKLKRDGKEDEVIGGAKGVVHDVKDAAHDATK